MRNLRPVMVFVDGSTFGSDISSGDMVSRIKQRGVPIVALSKGDDLRETLEKPII